MNLIVIQPSWLEFRLGNGFWDWNQPPTTSKGWPFVYKGPFGRDFPTIPTHQHLSTFRLCLVSFNFYIPSSPVAWVDGLLCFSIQTKSLSHAFHRWPGWNLFCHLTTRQFWQRQGQWVRCSFFVGWVLFTPPMTGSSETNPLKHGGCVVGITRSGPSNFFASNPELLWSPPVGDPTKAAMPKTAPINSSTQTLSFKSLRAVCGCRGGIYPRIPQLAWSFKYTTFTE